MKQIDSALVTELVLYIDNTSSLMGPGSHGHAIRANLERKVKKGTYRAELAPKAWLHLVDRAAKQYAAEFPGVRFAPADRRAAAEQLARAWEREADVGK